MAQVPLMPERRLQPIAMDQNPNMANTGVVGPATLIGQPASQPTMQTLGATGGSMPSNPGAPGPVDMSKPPMPMTPTTNRPPSATSPYAPPAAGSPGRGNPSPQQLAGFDNFADAAFQSATRRLDPRFAQAEQDFRQQMVNRGISEGTEAYDKAFANFSMDRNDAYAQAQNNALAQALAAQGQAFGQGFQDRSLAQSANQFNQGLGFQYAGLNEQNRQFDANLGQRESEFGRNFGFQNQRADMQDLMSLLGYGQSTNAYNNSLLGQDFNRAGGLFGLIPGMTPTQVDVLGPYQMQQQAAAQANANAQNASNGMWGAVGQLGSAFLMSDERLKTDIRKVGALDNGLTVYAYRYKAGGPTMIGVMAQEVLETHSDAVVDLGGFLAVDYDKVVA